MVLYKSGGMTPVPALLFVDLNLKGMNMAKNDDIEQNLLSGKSVDELIRQKINEEITKELEEAKKSAKMIKITEFSKLPTADVFGKNTTYLIFNRNTRQESFINGSQAESFIGLKNELREKLIRKEIDSFLTDDYYVKFHSATVTA